MSNAKAENISPIDLLDSEPVSMAEMVKLTSLSKPRILQLVDQGTFVKSGRNQYKGLKSLHNYIDYLRSLGIGSKAGTADYQEEKARLTKAQADKAELEAEVLAGKYVEISAVQTEWQTMLVAMKSKLLGIPAKTAPLLADIREPGEVKQLLDEYIRELLTELTQYDSDSEKPAS